MRIARTAAGLLAGVLALSLVAAETPPADGAGTAATRLLGAEVRVTGSLATPTTQLLDIVSSATTEGTPLASTTVVPVRIGDTAVGQTGASSDGAESARSEGGTYGDLAGTLGLAAHPIETTATATADRALATVGAATGQVGALLGQLGLDLNTAGVSSLATRDGAAATQGLQVSELALGLGDLGLDADLLGQLGLDTLLELLGALPGVLPPDLAGVPDVLDSLDDLEAALATLEATAAPLLTAIGLLEQIQTVLPDVVVLDALLDTLQALTSLDAVDLLAELTTNVTLIDDLSSVGCELPALLDVTNVEQALADAIACVTAQLDTIAADLTSGGVSGISGDPASLLDELTSIADALTALLPGELDTVIAQLDVVVGLVEQILALLGDLEGLLDLLPDLLADAAGMDLLEVGAFDVGTTAVAGQTVADSSASVLCDAVDVQVLGQAFTTPDCSEALAGLPDVTGAIGTAVDQLTGVLNLLPLGDVLQVGELRADLFTNLVEQVSEADGVVTATAGFNLLELAVPSLTLDPDQVTSALGGLGLPDVLGPVTTVLEDLLAGLEVLDTLGLAEAGALITTVETTLTDLGAPGGLASLVDDATALLSGLDLGDLGTLAEEISTPGLELLIDPVSTASFRGGGTGGTGGPAPAPAPAPVPDDGPSLPSTGGGLALLGVLALAGAGAMRRRR